MQVTYSPIIEAAIAAASKRKWGAVDIWVMANPHLATSAGWDGDNEIEIAERGILLGAEAQRLLLGVVYRADYNEASYFFLGSEASIVATINAL